MQIYIDAKLIDIRTQATYLTSRFKLRKSTSIFSNNQ